MVRWLWLRKVFEELITHQCSSLKKRINWVENLQGKETTRYSHATHELAAWSYWSWPYRQAYRRDGTTATCVEPQNFCKMSSWSFHQSPYISAIAKNRWRPDGCRFSILVLPGWNRNFVSIPCYCFCNGAIINVSHRWLWNASLVICRKLKNHHIGLQCEINHSSTPSSLRCHAAIHWSFLSRTGLHTRSLNKRRHIKTVKPGAPSWSARWISDWRIAERYVKPLSDVHCFHQEWQYTMRRSNWIVHTQQKSITTLIFLSKTTGLPDIQRYCRDHLIQRCQE